MRVLFCAIIAVIFVLCPVGVIAGEVSEKQNFERFEPVLSVILGELDSEGVPEEFICLAIAESGLKPGAVSSKGAAGIWQLMPATARTYGLVVNRKRDDRLDVRLSTIAAAKYIKHLMAMFDGDLSWTVAAYNAGGHNIRKYYQKGAKIRVLKDDYPSAYNLSVTVQRCVDELWLCKSFNQGSKRSETAGRNAR